MKQAVKKWFWHLGVLLLLAIGGCAAAGPMRVAGLPESMCKHCNCLMPTGLDPQGVCPVCNCGKHSHQCVRGR